MGLLEFFNSGGNINSGNPRNGSSDIDSFCQKFFANAGPDYRNTPTDFLKLCFRNRDMILGMLNSPLLKQIETVANNAVNKGIVSKDTVNSFEKALTLFK